MQRRRFLALFLLSIVLPALNGQTRKNASPPQSPSQFLGFEVGADRNLADYKQISDYLRALAASSSRVEIETLGKTTLGKDMIMAVISTEENLRNKARYREIARRLADPRGLSQAQIDALAAEGKSIFLLTCNIHSSEIGSSQMAMEWAYRLATSGDPETLRRLNDVIVLLVPSLNPDGETMITEWYRKYLGTKYEGGPMPWLYHHYVGHDNNRDWYMLTQIETKNVNRMVYHEWFPQFWLDEHQMGSYGPRIYIPPNADPVAKLVNPLVHRGNNLIGATMGWRLEEAGKSGVIYNYSFDAYWPGGTRNTGWWKNMLGVLTEVASARIATPMTISPTELQGGAKGLIEYEQQINFPNPWPGGVWRLRDIMDYELIVSDAALETMSKYRREFMRGVAAMANEAIRTADADTFWRIPARGQRDPGAVERLARLLMAHGVEVRYSAGQKDFLISTSQPYGRFVDEMMGIQRYPEVRPAPGSGILAPYDVSAWSLPLMMGVKAERVRLSPEEQRGSTVVSAIAAPAAPGNHPYYSVPWRQNSVFTLVNEMQKSGGEVFLRRGATPVAIFAAHPKLAGTAANLHVALEGRADLPADAQPLKPRRIGLYKPWIASIDEGWTRFVLEQHSFNVKNIDNKEMKAGNLNAAYDVIILPDTSREIIVDGRAGREGFVEAFPPEYTGGIGRDGVRALREFADKGGTLITLARSSELVFGEDFGLPVRNAIVTSGGAAGEGRRAVSTSDFNIPGSLLRVYVDTTHPVGNGLPSEVAAFVDGPLAFQTSSPPPDVERSVIAWYPDDARDILLSGYAHGEEKLARKAAIVSFTRGQGRVVMFGFRVQHRAQTEGTFQLLFNAIEWGATAP